MQECQRGMEVKGKRGEVVGNIFIIPTQGANYPRIIFLDSEERRAKSMRSSTELLNTLLKRDVSEEQLEEVVYFLSRCIENIIAEARK